MAAAAAAADPPLSYLPSFVAADDDGYRPEFEHDPPPGYTPRQLKFRRMLSVREAEQNHRDAQDAFSAALGQPLPSGHGSSCGFPTSSALIDECGRVVVVVRTTAAQNLAGYEGVDDGWAGGVWKRRTSGAYGFNALRWEESGSQSGEATQR